jgi:hypothetical protein
MGQFPPFVAAMKLQTFYDKRKIFFGDDQIIPHKPEALNSIFTISLLGTPEAFLAG